MLCVFTAAGQLLGSRRMSHVSSLIWSPCGAWVAATEYIDGPTLWVWRPSTGAASACRIVKGHSEDVLCWWVPCHACRLALLQQSDPARATRLLCLAH